MASPSQKFPEIFSLRRILIRNTKTQLIFHAVSLGVGLATTFVLSRYFGVERFGGLNYVFAFYYFFLMFEDMGIGVIVIRECSRHPEMASRIIGTMRTFQLISSFVLVGIAWLLVWKISFSPELKPALYLYALILPLMALEHPAVAFQVHLNAKYPSVMGLFKALGNFVFLVALIALGLGMTGYVLALVMSEILVMGGINYFSRHFVRPVWTFDLNLCVQILKSSATVAVIGIFVAIINRVDFLMLERMTDLHQLGLYAAVYKVTNLLESLPLAMMATLYPLMSRYAQGENRSRLKPLYIKCFLLFAAIALPMGCAITFFARPLVLILFGPKFLEAIPGLRILVWATVFLYLAIPGGNLLISLGREKINLGVNILAACLNIVLNFLWIPKYGFVGAAAATSMSYFFIFVLTFSATRRVLKSFDISGSPRQ